METKELKITIPEGFDIDKEKSTLEKIVFKKKDTKPRSWEEYCKQQMEKKKIGYYINDTECTSVEAHWNGCISPHIWKNVLPSKELTESFLAMMQIMSLRHDWIHKWSVDNGMTDDWNPDWRDTKYCICGKYNNDIAVCSCSKNRYPLSFPSEEMAEDFMYTFEDLLNIAHPLI